MVILWFRNNLRLHDNRIFQSLKPDEEAIGFFAMSPNLIRGGHREEFLRQSLKCLSYSLGKIGIPLCISTESPYNALPKLAKKLKATTIFTVTEPGTLEKSELDKTSRQIKQVGIDLQVVREGFLLDESTGGIEIENWPELFTNFRKGVEPILSGKSVPHPLKRVAPVTRVEDNDIITTSSSTASFLGIGDVSETSDSCSQASEIGGELAGIARVQRFLWETKAIQSYKLTRNQMMGDLSSSRFSPWLSVGCISPRYVLKEIEKFEGKFGANEGTYWLKFELLWREFFRGTALKHEGALFKVDGIQKLDIPWNHDEAAFHRWTTGQTGFPIVDANMRELFETGFMSNRGRQIVASFLTKNLMIDWRWGASWFESQLIDYDVSSNWGNWQYAAGIGNDGRKFRLFNLNKQAKDHDFHGDHARHWLPELRSINGFQVHTPSPSQCIQLGYPLPIVNFERSSNLARKVFENALRSNRF